MASSNKTKNILLNNWVEDDKPRMEDFNKDNEILDKEIADRYTKKDVDALLSKKVSVKGIKENQLSYLNSDIAAYYVNSYCKTDDGLIVLNMSCHLKTFFENKEPIAQLPSGFRPAKVIEVNAAAQAKGVKTGCSMYISNNGNISPVLTGLINVDYLQCSCTFLVAQ